MGQFVDPEGMRNRLTPSAKNFAGGLNSEAMDDLLIIPAERMIAEHCNLNLNTDGHPWRWHGRFTGGGTDAAQQLARYLDDYRRAVYLQVNRMALSMHGEVSRSVAGASTKYGADTIHPSIDAIMERWSEPQRWYRA